MIRTVPKSISDKLDLYIRTYYSLLRSTEAVRVASLEESYAGTGASLHPNPEDPIPDISAFTYAVARLPSCMHQVRTVLLGQSGDVFKKNADIDVSKWRRVYAVARRRKMFFDNDQTLACTICSVSDIDDLIPILTAYQIEWNKLHQRFQGSVSAKTLRNSPADSLMNDNLLRDIRTDLGLDENDFSRLHNAWRHDARYFFKSLASRRSDLRLRLLAGSVAAYRQAVQSWWRSVVHAAGLGSLGDRSVYFVSSNPHGIPNILSGYARNMKAPLLTFLNEQDPENLMTEWSRIQEDQDLRMQDNFLYYLLRHYSNFDKKTRRRQLEFERNLGIIHVSKTRYLDVGANIIQLGMLDPGNFDPRLHMPGLDRLKQSDALVVNIDYPLGMAAYHLFSQISASVPSILGIYIMGKAASLNGRVGDVMIPNVVYDEHSQNTYLIKNIFQAGDVAPHLAFGNVFDNQKAVTVRGTLLQNQDFMTVFYKEGYTDIEMEAGPYLSAVYEDIYPQRYPNNEIVNLFINAPYDIGLLHYASDTPYSRRKNLLSKSLSYFGVDATYASCVAIMRRILQVELARLSS